MEAKTRCLDHSGTFDEQENPGQVARGFVYGTSIGVLLWVLAAALVIWLV